MENGPVAHRYVFAHRHRMVVIHVHHTVILDIRARTDGDRRPVAPQHRAEEHAQQHRGKHTPERVPEPCSPGARAGFRIPAFPDVWQ